MTINIIKRATKSSTTGEDDTRATVQTKQDIEFSHTRVKSFAEAQLANVF